MSSLSLSFLYSQLKFIEKFFFISIVSIILISSTIKKITKISNLRRGKNIGEDFFVKKWAFFERGVSAGCQAKSEDHNHLAKSYESEKEVPNFSVNKFSRPVLCMRLFAAIISEKTTAKQPPNIDNIDRAKLPWFSVVFGFLSLATKFQPPYFEPLII